jgi:hypothetical protein
VRLNKQEKVEEFAATMADCRAELEDAVRNLDEHYAELKQAAAERLGSLFNPSDYPETLAGLFSVSWDFPSVEPPAYLVQLSPALYAQEQERVRARFDEAVRPGRAGVPGGVRPPGRPPHRADLGPERRRRAQGVPRQRRGQPRRVLLPLP